MPTYLVETPHTEEECATAGEDFIKHPRAKAILDKTYWGCSFGRHVAWTIADFANVEEARLQLAEPLKSKAVITPVEVFSYDQMMQAHQ